MKNNFGKITYKFVSYFIESHPDLSDAEKYRYLYLCMKSMVVSNNFDEIEKVLDRKDWLSDNIQIFEDFLLEEDFAHSQYKSQINKAVLKYGSSNQDPFTSANYLSRFFLYWAYKVLKLGNLVPLKSEHLGKIDGKYSSKSFLKSIKNIDLVILNTVMKLMI